MTVVLATLGVSLALAVLLGAGRLLFSRRVRRELRELLSVAPSRERPAAPGSLPAPVLRYRALAVGDRPPVRVMLLRHGGSFATRLGGALSAIRGAQLFTADPPGFVWIGRVRLLPGLWFDARDLSIRGKGAMRVLVNDLYPVVDARGPTLDQGAGLRLLAELPWFPTALFDPRIVTWSAIDDTHAQANLHLGTLDVSAVFEFGDDGLPVRATAERFMDGDGARRTGQLTAWGGEYSDYRAVAGMRVPFEAKVSWLLDSGPFTYAHWRVDSIEFDVEPPFPAGAFPVGALLRPPAH